MQSRTIERYGIVQRKKYTPGKQILFVKWSFRLTAKDAKQQEILVCDVLIYDGLEFNLEDEEKRKTLHEEKLQEIEDLIKKKLPSFVKRIEAEYSASLR